MSRSGIVTFLEKYGCPTFYNGYVELLELLLVAGAASWAISKNLKCIYYDTARIVSTTRLCLERNLRTLIIAWSKKPGFEKLFDKIPTNAEFIIRLTEMISDDSGHDEYSAFDLLLS